MNNWYAVEKSEQVERARRERQSRQAELVKAARDAQGGRAADGERAPERTNLLVSALLLTFGRR